MHRYYSPLYIVHGDDDDDDDNDDGNDNDDNATGIAASRTHFAFAASQFDFRRGFPHSRTW